MYPIYDDVYEIYAVYKELECCIREVEERTYNRNYQERLKPKNYKRKTYWHRIRSRCFKTKRKWQRVKNGKKKCQG